MKDAYCCFKMFFSEKETIFALTQTVHFCTGFWLGLLVCVILQSTFYIIVIFRLNWKKVTEEVLYTEFKKSHMTIEL